MKSRVLTAIGLIPFVLGTFFCAAPLPIFVLAWVVALVCTREIAVMFHRREVWIGLLLAVAILIPAALSPLTPIEGALIAIGGFALGTCGTYAYVKPRSKRLPMGLLGLLWLTCPLYCLFRLHELVPPGRLWEFANPVLLAIVPLWGGDTAAIFAGKAFGKRPLAPTISPKKTVEGGIANLLACSAVGVPLGLWIGYSWWVALGCGVIAGIFGQLGDLFESFVKRQAGVKDSGTLLPGHGGLLDRVDSVLFTAPVVYALLGFFKLR